MDSSAMLPSIPTHSSTAPALRCCCGRNDCAFLDHNNAALTGVEKDLAMAARLGQALLHRHESYMAEAEKDRANFLASIDSLEQERRQVQAENARIVEENRSLLERLEGLNSAVASSDAQVRALTIRLESAQAEIAQLAVSANRAAQLEAQLGAMEAEQTRLQECLQSVQNGERSAVQRWKKAECTLRDLHDQVDRIEREAREEKERHAELVQRMERRRAVERELDGANGRLKSAASPSDLARNPPAGTAVVSRFVRDILQDNATLQMGIIELREMLESSNQEVQSLREQILSHQPLTTTTLDQAADDEHDGGTPRLPSTTLDEELQDKMSLSARRISQEFHIHHHYHTPSSSVSSTKDKKITTPHRRGRKRRSLLLGSSNSNRPAMHFPRSSVSSASTILSQTSASIPPDSSSLASSPQSGYRSSLIFDRPDHGFDSSQPTSPESAVFSSPLAEYTPRRRRKSSFGGPFRSFDVDAPDFNDASDGLGLQDATIPEESEDSTGSSGVVAFRPLHRRSTSHDSLFSIAGMDIHTHTPTRLHHPPARIGVSGGSYRPPTRIVAPSVGLLSTPPIISTTTIMADKGSLPRIPEQSSKLLLASVAASTSSSSSSNGGGNSVPTDAASVTSHETASTDSTIPSKKSTLGRRMGGWVLGKWGVAPSPSEQELKDTAESLTPAPSNQDPDKSKPELPAFFRFRSPGVNQSGPIFGLRPPPRAPIVIHAEGIDESLLRESLAE